MACVIANCLLPSVRYVVCLNKISYTDPVHEHLFNINSKLNELKEYNENRTPDEQLDVLEVCSVLIRIIKLLPRLPLVQAFSMLVL